MSPGTSFKSCPRVGGIPESEFLLRVDPVSSRAPVWGASRGRRLQRARSHSFKSCPRVGGICAQHPASLGPVGFKSCPRVGGIIASCARHRPCSQVSSRAPVWGASRLFLQGYEAMIVSSRAPVWGASEAVKTDLVAAQFQVVPPCGGHLKFTVLSSCVGLVSSRAPVWGASAYNCQFFSHLNVSSRAPVWGAS